MGTLYYGPARLPVTIDDRTLVHLRAIIMRKFTCNEGLGVSWLPEAVDGGGQNMVWLAPSIALEFRFDDARLPRLNAEWIDLMTLRASSPSGLRIVPEPPELEHGARNVAYTLTAI